MESRHVDEKLCPLSPSKRKKIEQCESLDYISRLPDALIQHILSFLPMEDAIKTGVLSKRWGSVWNEVPILNFCHHPHKQAGEFVTFVNQSLRLHIGREIEKFFISFMYNASFYSQANNWVRFARERYVKELLLDFSNDGIIYVSGVKEYQLPELIFSSSTLTKLKTMLCNFKPTGYVSWPSLKTLSIGHTELNADAILKILFGCPKLELLKLHDCNGNNKFIVSSSSLKELVIDHFRGSSGSVMEISCPNIHSLSLLGYMHRARIKLLSNLSSVVEANLGFVLRTGHTHKASFYKNHRSLLEELLGKLRHAQKLTMGTWCLQVLSICKVLSLPSPLSKRKTVILNIGINKWDLPGIASLLQSSPDLENLKINMIPSQITDFEDDENLSDSYIFDWNSTESNYKCLYRHLKSVEITGFGRWIRLEFFLSLMKFLLKKAKLLEHMVIYGEEDILSGNSISVRQKLQDYLQASQLFLSYPRASPNAVILFKTFPIDFSALDCNSI